MTELISHSIRRQANFLAYLSIILGLMLNFGLYYPAYGAEVGNFAKFSQKVRKIAIIGPLDADAETFASSPNSDSEPTNNIAAPIEADTNDLGTPSLIVNAVITAYTSTPDQTDDSPFIAATGKHVYDGMMAVNGLPFGTKIRVPEVFGEQIFTVDDRMNRRYKCLTYGAKRCRMDVWLDTSRLEAKKFGVKQAVAEIYLPDKKLAKR